MTEHHDEKAQRSVAARLRGDGTGYFLDCPVCHFYKTADPGQPCRRLGCDGTVVKVEFVVTPPGSPGDGGAS